MLERQSKYQRRYEMKSIIPSGFVLHKKDPSSLIFFHYTRQFQPGSPFDVLYLRHPPNCVYLSSISCRTKRSTAQAIYSVQINEHTLLTLVRVMRYSMHILDRTRNFIHLDTDKLEVPVSSNKRHF